MDWTNDGSLLSSFPGSVIRNPSFYFKEGATWGMVSSSKFSIRYMDSHYVFSNAGLAVIPDNREDNLYVIGLLNSEVSSAALGFLAPTLNYSNGDIGRIPVVVPANRADAEKIVNSNIVLSKEDYDSNEISWDFKHHPLV